MKLRYSATSPYVRKVVISLKETGLESQVELVVTNAWAPDTDLPQDNPLGKVPALVTGEGDFYDSPVIADYVDSLHDGAKLFPAAGPARWTALRRQALADGILDAALLWRVETMMRPQALVWSDWVARQKGVVLRGLDQLEREAASFGDLFTIGEIAIVCALGYLDFRFAEETAWRQTRPALAAWYAAISARPSVAATVPLG